MGSRELSRIDWSGRSVETTELQRTLREGRYRRIAGEILEIREAARLMAEQDDAFLAASAQF